MTGWRIGWAVAPSEVAKAMGSLQSHSTSNPTSFAQWGALAALEGSQDAVEEMRREFEARRDLICSLADQIPASAITGPRVRFISLWIFQLSLAKDIKAPPLTAEILLHPSCWSRRQLHWCREAVLGCPTACGFHMQPAESRFKRPF